MVVEHFDSELSISSEEQTVGVSFESKSKLLVLIRIVRMNVGMGEGIKLETVSRILELLRN